MLRVGKEYTKNLRSAVAAIKDFASEGTFIIDRNRIFFHALDEAKSCQIVYINNNINVETDEDTTKIHLNIQELNKILQKTDAPVELEYHDGKLKITEEGSVRKKTFIIPTLSMENYDGRVIEYNKFTGHITVDAKEFHDIIKEAALVNSMLSLKLTEDGKLIATAADKYVGKQYQTELNGTNNEGTAESFYSINYLGKAVAACRQLNEIITLSIADKAPLRIKTESGNDILEVLIAPIIRG